MTLPIAAPRALLRFDAIQIERPSANAGKTVVTYTQIYDGRGTLGVPNPQEFIYATDADRSTVIEHALALELGIDIQKDDRVITPRGTFTVIAVAQHRLHQRALLRKVI